MGTFNLTVTYPDAQQTRILDALKAHWTETDPETQLPVVPTTPEVIEKLRQVVVNNIKDIVHKVERDAAVQQAADAVTVVDAA
jgi:hypothetical protein